MDPASTSAVEWCGPGICWLWGRRGLSLCMLLRSSPSQRRDKTAEFLCPWRKCDHCPSKASNTCLFVFFGTELSHTRSSPSEYARDTHPAFSCRECPLPWVTITPLPPPASFCPFFGSHALWEAAEAPSVWSPIGNVPCAFSCLPPPAPGLSPTPL